MSGLALPPTDRILEVVIDADPPNEVDDQFALVWALLRPDRLRVRALLAAPWTSDPQTYRRTDPLVDQRRHAPKVRDAVTAAEGQQQAVAELGRLVQVMGVPVPVYPGADRFLPDASTPVSSPAVDALIDLAYEDRDGPLYVLGIACATNLASAILQDPGIVDRVQVVWTSAHPTWWPRPTASYNLSLDLAAGRVLFDSGVPLVYLPGYYVGEELRTTGPELERHVRGRGPVGDYLWQTWTRHWMTRDPQPGFSKVIWDMINVAYVLEPSWLATDLVTAPVLGEDGRWQHPAGRHLIREAYDLDRDACFGDLFARLGASLT